MAFTPFHNLRGATTQDNELVAIGDIPKKGIKSLQISNIRASAAATVDLYIFKDSTDTTPAQTVYILNQVVIPFGVSLFLNEHEIYFDNNVYSLHMNVGSSDTVDVVIKK
jgi:hypothetical protein